MKLVQQLPDNNVLQVLHYVDYHNDHHYVITMSVSATPRIYWWTSELMSVYQHLKTVILSFVLWHITSRF